MKHAKHMILSAGVKICFVLSVICSLWFFTIAMKAKQMADDVWKQLGLTLPDAHRNINNSFIQGRLYYFGAKNAKNIAQGDRVAVVNQLVAYTKKYARSQEFITAYKDFRAKMKPNEPEALPAVSIETIKEEERKRLEQALKVAEEGLNSPNPKIKNGAPTRIENIKKELKALDDPDNPTIKRKLTQANAMSNAVQQQHATAVQQFELKYPEDPQVLLKRRLQEILDLTADVDYDAELKEGYRGKKIFANPVYEKKPAEWKLAFRAGKQTTDAVRAAAQQWLNEFK
jgi:hypothetical protein